jgi:Protein of unknown function (DUF3226)
VSNDVIKEDELNYMIVEGPEDAQVLYHLLRYYRLDNQVSIQQKEGIDNLLKSLDVELKRRSETRLAIIVDADIDIAPRWQALRHRLLNAGYTVIPSQPDPEGTILKQEGMPSVGIWLMPNNILPGTLEDFARLLILPGDALWPVAEASVQQAIAVERRFPETQVMKANMHTWLAWQEEPGKPMGQAITKRYLDAAASHAQPLIGWLRRLFEIV